MRHSMSILHLLICAFILSTTVFLTGCSSEAPQTEASKEVSQQKLDEMRKSMMDSMQKKSKKR